MSEVPFYSKHNFVELMQRKRGDHYTLGWLKAAYALPTVDEATELDIIQREIPTLLSLPDFVVDAV
jgi:hypothetical protein